jgi:hypothetical protein
MAKTKKTLWAFLLLLLIMASTALSLAEEVAGPISAIYLKDGTVIDCEMGWIEGEIFYYRKYGGTIGMSLKTVDVGRTYKKHKEKEEEDKKKAMARQAEAEEEADKNISVSKPIDTPKKSYSEICKSWIGHDINSLVDKWGYPTRNFKAPNGNDVYVYDKSRTIRFRAQTAPPFISSEMVKWALESPAREYHCGGKAFFETDRSGKIIKAQWEGKFERIK